MSRLPSRSKSTNVAPPTASLGAARRGSRPGRGAKVPSPLLRRSSLVSGSLGSLVTPVNTSRSTIVVDVAERDDLAGTALRGVAVAALRECRDVTVTSSKLPFTLCMRKRRALAAGGEVVGGAAEAHEEIGPAVAVEVDRGRAVSDGPGEPHLRGGLRECVCSGCPARRGPADWRGQRIGAGVGRGRGARRIARARVRPDGGQKEESHRREA